MTADTKLRKLLTQVEAFRALDPEIPSQIMSTLLLIALDPGVRVTSLAPRLGMTTSSASRNVENLALITTKTGERRGWGFVEYRDDPGGDRRAKALYLTPKGEKFVESLL